MKYCLKQSLLKKFLFPPHVNENFLNIFIHFTLHNVYIISVFSSPDPKSHASTQVLPSLSSYINFCILIFFSEILGPFGTKLGRKCSMLYFVDHNYTKETRKRKVAKWALSVINLLL